MKVSIIGCGNIGKELARFIDNDKHFELVGLVDIDEKAIVDTEALLKRNVPRMSIREAVKADLVIEAADKSVVEEIVRLCSGKVLVLSVGGLINVGLHTCKIYIPSGAIAGLDAIKAVRGKITSLTLTTTKHPRAFGIPEEKKVLFSGNFRDAVKKFPQNINVAASLHIASQFEDIHVTIIADPAATLNTHVIVCTGEFGKITIKTENKPSKNPKTSYLAVLSAISVLNGFHESYKF